MENIEMYNVTILLLIGIIGVSLKYVGTSSTSRTRTTTNRIFEQGSASNDEIFSDLIGEIVASSREGCQLGKDLSEMTLRARVLRPRRLQRWIRRKTRRGQLIILDATLDSSNLEHSLNQNLLTDYTGVQTYSILFKTVRKHSKVARRLMRNMRNKLRTLAVQFRQAIVFRGGSAATIPASIADVRRELARRQNMDEVEKCINDYAVIREIGAFLNRMSRLYSIYNEHAQNVASRKLVCY